MTDFREYFQLPSLNNAIDDDLNNLNKSWNNKDYDSSINYAKSIVESTSKFIYFLIKDKESPNGNLNDVVKTAIQAMGLDYTMAQYQLIKDIINKVGNVRNHTSVSHGTRKLISNNSKEEARFYCALCVDFSTYLLKIYNQKFGARNRICGKIYPENEKNVSLSVEGYNVWLTRTLDYISDASIEFNINVDLEDAINEAADVINKVLPEGANWNDRVRKDKNKFQVNSTKYDRSCDVIFVRVNGGWLINIDNVNDNFLDIEIKSFRPFLSVKEKYELGSKDIILQREKLNNLLSTQNIGAIRKNSTELIKEICSEICFQNDWSIPKGNAEKRVKEVISDFSEIISKSDLLKNVLVAVLKYIQSTSLTLEYLEDYMLYVAIVDDISIFLINLQRAYKRIDQHMPVNIVGGIFDNKKLSFSKIKENKYLDSNPALPALDIELNVEDGIIKKVIFKFKTVSDSTVEFVNSHIRDYLPEDAKYISSKAEYNEYYSKSINKYYKIKYSKGKSKIGLNVELTVDEGK